MPDAERIFSFVRTPERTRKPRTYGLTMVSGGDYWLAVAGMNWLHDLVDWGKQYIDYYKVGHTMIFQPKDLVLKKLALLKHSGIEPYLGGNTTEVAILQNSLGSFFDELHRLNIVAMEVSSTVLPLTVDEKAKLIEKARGQGFTVFAEVGKKLIGQGGPKTRMTTSDVIQEMKACLSAGAFKVVYEHTEIEDLVRKGSGFEPLLEIAAAVSVEKVMFEVPHGHWHEVSPYATFYILQFGPNVNIGDVDPEKVIGMESLRAGLSAKTLGKVPAV